MIDYFLDSALKLYSLQFLWVTLQRRGYFRISLTFLQNQIVMVGVTQNDPPAGAPPGVTDNGFRAFAEGATFEGVMTTNIVIFVSVS